MRRKFPIITLSAILILICLGAMLSVDYLNPQTIEGTVTDKYNKRSSDTDYFYVVVEDHNHKEHVIKNSDLLFKRKFNSADIQAQIKKDHKYKINVTGFRVPFLDLYPILNKIKGVK